MGDKTKENAKRWISPFFKKKLWLGKKYLRENLNLSLILIKNKPKLFLNKNIWVKFSSYP
jgi:hypothetical protein